LEWDTNGWEMVRYFVNPLPNTALPELCYSTRMGMEMHQENIFRAPTSVVSVRTIPLEDPSTNR